jgi:hypothetical protein
MRLSCLVGSQKQLNQIRTFCPPYCREREVEGRLLFHRHELSFAHEPKNRSPVRFRRRSLHKVLQRQVCFLPLLRPSIK